MNYMYKDLLDITDINLYLEYLSKIKDNISILVSVKDTPGSRMPSLVLEKMKELGFSSFTNELWTMYTGALNKGNILLDRVASYQKERVSAEVNIENHEIALYSYAWENGNRSTILIDGFDYSCNKRGINFVICDFDNNELIDSAFYDSHNEKSCFGHDIELVRKYKKVSEHRCADICVLGCWNSVNYGSMLNGYATYLILKQMGKKVCMISKPDSVTGDLEMNDTVHNMRFVRKYFDDQDVLYKMNSTDISQINNISDLFMVGSDQLWNYYVSFEKKMYLPFINDDKVRISFCTSMGDSNDNVPESDYEEVKRELNKFDAVSVRENFTKKTLKEKYGVDSSVLLEPVFDLDKNIYYELIKESNFKEDSPYILAFILDPTEKKLNVIKQIERTLNKKVIVIADGAYTIFNSEWDHYDNKDEFSNLYYDMDIPDFLAAFANADFVVTDSFHGTCFSIIFEKKFISLVNYIRGEKRFEDILGRFNLLDRLVKDTDSFKIKESFFTEIDYKAVNLIIEKEKNESLKWLKKSLEIKKEHINQVAIKKDNKTNYHNQIEVDNLLNNPDFIKLKILFSLLKAYGIKDVVVSPGGRDVPLVRMLEYNEEHFNIHRVVDERSAGYFGLGVAAQSGKPVACICTSGTAASNYLPAVTEAFFTGIPLIMITADRYSVYHGQGEDQTIPQKNIYSEVIKKEITVPEGKGYNVEYQTRRDISECILEATHGVPGPVHINFAIDNVFLGSRVDRRYWKVEDLHHPLLLRVGANDKKEYIMRWVDELKKQNRILIVYGQHAPCSPELKAKIDKFASKYNCAIATDLLSNYNSEYSFMSYNMLQKISNQEFNEKLSPDIVISVGGKRLMNDPLTFKIRGGRKSIRHWSVAPDGKVKDFYFRLSSVIEMSMENFFEWFGDNAGNISNNCEYLQAWKTMLKMYDAPEVNRFNALYIQKKFIPAIPDNSILHLGVGQSFYDSRRYNLKPSVNVFCNMGTNGIDGCTSTFMGQTTVEKNNLCFLLVGDLSFFYDMNSIWNKELHNNIRILLVNNSGTDLLRNHNLKSITSEHHTSAKGWVEANGFKYISASTREEYDDLIGWFVSHEPNAPVFFEVFCE